MSAERKVPRGRSLLHPDPAAVPGTSRESPMSITDLNDRTRALLEKHVPARLRIQGEVTDFKRNRNGHWYFGLRDANAQISCVV